MGKIGSIAMIGVLVGGGYLAYRAFKGLVPDIGGFLGGLTGGAGDVAGGVGGFLGDVLGGITDFFGGLFDGGEAAEEFPTGLVDPEAGAPEVAAILPPAEVARLQLGGSNVMAHISGGFDPTITPVEAVVVRAGISGLSPIEQAIFEAEARRTALQLRGR